MPKISKVGKFRKAAAETATPANTPVSKGKAASVSRAHASGSKESLAATIAAAVTTAATASNDTSNLSRGKRKRLAKRGQYLKKEQLILSSLKLTKEEEQKKRIDGLDAIKEALLATVKKTSGTATAESKEEKEDEKVNMLKTNKSRQLLMQKEVAQMNLVLQHPSFQADPFATIREHLTNTLAKDSAKQKKEQVQHVRDRKEKEEKKKAVKKEQGIKKKRKKFNATRSR
jgi:ABC-type dipeptide/oligopeptide/nickel transport system ATPase component